MKAGVEVSAGFDAKAGAVIVHRGWLLKSVGGNRAVPVCTVEFHRKLLAAAASCIERGGVDIHDLAAECGQILDNVKHMLWFRTEVAAMLATSTKKWARAALLYK